ncbi:MAG: hypothetical protein ONB05_09235 [candidate division KSB1 bacterium]|nr:hypothetical protein [candidate division KSB1 bacterium]
MDESKWKTLLMDWLQGATLASTKMIGAKRVKTMIRGMSLVFVNSLARRLEEQTNEKLMTPSASIKEAAEKFNQVEIRAQLCQEKEVIIKEINTGKVEVTVHNCLYGDFCNEVLSRLLSTGDFNEKTIPCLRLSNSAAAATHLAGIRCPYYLIQFAPGAVCKGVIEG